ncbi:PIN domain-containing protein [Rhizobium paknamense]|uniref:Nucleic-acid-binding protein n=1 Tax=Rhizobium paknamense TaxID=1206817 RepID=A0ABU0IFM9_9HYPH|nr:type II toxin-antitoxin system VapC family toxin [Rhizobium paknamense]MDQ0457063.1 putative nucleic-acid-binding protein [Rhizobium paknamense]
MIGIDTNVLLRFLLADDAEQFEAAKHFISERSVDDPAYISLVVVAEMAWVLKRSYRFSNADIVDVLRKLVPAEQFLFEDEDILDAMIEDETLRQSDLSDRIVAHLALRQGASRVVTFDRKAARDVSHMELLA